MRARGELRRQVGFVGATAVLLALAASCGSSGGQGGSGGAAGVPATGGAAGGGSGGKGGSSGAAGGAAGQAGTPGCTTPAHVLPLNPANPQDGITLSGFYVDTDTWNAAKYTVSQTMYVCDYDNWYVVAKMDDSAGDGAVKTYPNVHMDFDSAPAISSFTSISSTLATSGRTSGSTSSLTTCG